MTQLHVAHMYRKMKLAPKLQAPIYDILLSTKLINYAIGLEKNCQLTDGFSLVFKWQ